MTDRRGDEGEVAAGVAQHLPYDPGLPGRWAERLPRLEESNARASALAPTLIGLTLERARAIVDADDELTLEVVRPGRGPMPTIGRFGVIEVTVDEGRVVAAR